jgi:Subtilase family
MSPLFLSAVFIAAVGLHVFISGTYLYPDSDAATRIQRAIKVHDLVRLQDRIENNKIFQLNAACNDSCRARVTTFLVNQLGCTHVSILGRLDLIEGRCSDSGKRLGFQTGELAQYGLMHIEHLYNNTRISIPEEKPQSGDSETDMPPEVRERMKRTSSRFSRSFAWLTSTRAAQIVDWSLWHLDRIDQYDAYQTFDSKFNMQCFPNRGIGSTVYVIDTGCIPDHNELAGRTTTYSAKYNSGRDDNGHGTHVAGLAAGKTTGVCKECKVVCLKTMGSDGSGSFSDIVDAIEHILDSHNGAAGPGVVVMSLAGIGSSHAFDRAIRALSRAGILPVVASGNYDRDACMYTPGNIVEAITVAATTAWDTLYSLSNSGNVSLNKLSGRFAFLRSLEIRF